MRTALSLFPTSSHANQVEGEGAAGAAGAAGAGEAVQHASLVDCEDGYKREVLLFEDEDVSTLDSFREEGSLQRLLWQPVVRFDSAHYIYKTAPDGAQFIVQQFISSDLNDTPPRERVDRAAASTLRPTNPASA